MKFGGAPKGGGGGGVLTPRTPSPGSAPEMLTKLLTVEYNFDFVIQANIQTLPDTLVITI